MRSAYVKVILFDDTKTNLNGAKVVGQGEDYLLLERAAPKQRSAEPKKRKPRAKKSEPQVEAVSA